MGKIGFYAGSFDPFTKGHLAVLCKALCAFDKVIIGIGVNPSKKGLFDVKERNALIRSSIDDLIQQYRHRNLNRIIFSTEEEKAVSRLIEDPNCLEIYTYNGLTVDMAFSFGATSLIRGTRNAQDDAEEQALSIINEELLRVRRKHLDSVLYSVPAYQNVSSTTVKNLCSLGEYILVQKYVMPSVHEALMKKYLYGRYVPTTNYMGEKETLWSKLCQNYTSQTKRYYHNLSHIGYCLNYADIFDKLYKKGGSAFEEKWKQVLDTAIFYHDYVNTGQDDDETRSADQAELDLLSLQSYTPEVKKLILTTKHTGEYADVLLFYKVIHDVDLAILGDKDNYGVYAMQVRREYSQYDTEKYAAARIKVLRQLLQSDYLYLTEFFRDMFSETAEQNMRDELSFWESRVKDNL